MNARLSAKPDKGSCSPYKKTPRPVVGRGVLAAGGAGGIRTLVTGLPYTRFPGEPVQPLWHLSMKWVQRGIVATPGADNHSLCHSGRLALGKTRPARSARLQHRHHLSQDTRS